MHNDIFEATYSKIIQTINIWIDFAALEEIFSKGGNESFNAGVKILGWPS